MTVRTILVSSFVLLSLPLSSQDRLTRQHNHPRIGDSFNWSRVNYQSGDSAGINRVWNFSKIGAAGKVEPVKYGLKVSDGSLVREAFSTCFYYQEMNDTVCLTGFENESSVIRHVFANRMMHYPFAYGDSLPGYIYTRGKYGDRLELEQLGRGYIIADGEGTLILPGNDTVKNVLQVRTVQRYAQNAVPVTARYYLPDSLRDIVTPDSIELHLQNDSSVIELTITDWYARGYRYPLFESVDNRIITKDTVYVMNRFSLYCSTDSMKYFVGYDPENEALLSEPDIEPEAERPGLSWKDRLKINLYPNPVQDILHVEYTLPNPASINLSLQDINGRLLYTSGTKREEGVSKHEIPVSGYPAGQLLLVLRIENEVITLIIIKE